MELSLIKIGNSKALILPKAILDKYSIVDKVELTLEENYMILKPILEPRKNWEKAFKKMHKNGDDKFLIDDIFVDELFEE